MLLFQEPSCHILGTETQAAPAEASSFGRGMSRVGACQRAGPEPASPAGNLATILHPVCLYTACVRVWTCMGARIPAVWSQGAFPVQFLSITHGHSLRLFPRGLASGTRGTRPMFSSHLSHLGSALPSGPPACCFHWQLAPPLSFSRKIGSTK